MTEAHSRAREYLTERFAQDLELFDTAEQRPSLYGVPDDAIIFRIQRSTDPQGLGGDEYVALDATTLEVIWHGTHGD
jgi:hypothetical protein